MEYRTVFHRHILPKLHRIAKSDYNIVSSNRSTFGLGLTIKEKNEQQEKLLEENRYFVDFRVSVEYQLKNDLFAKEIDRIIEFQENKKKEGNLNSNNNNRNRNNNNNKQLQQFGNIIEVRCSPSDVVSSPSSSSFSSSHLQNVGENSANNETKTTTTTRRKNHHTKSLLSTTVLEGIQMQSLSVDPSSLFEAMGLERPFGKKKKIGNKNKLQNKLKLSGGGGGKEEENKLLLSSSNQNNNNSSLTSSSSSTNFSELIPWEMQNVPISEYRRSFYRIGNDSIFSVGNIPRPIRFAAMNFLSREANSSSSVVGNIRQNIISMGSCEKEEEENENHCVDDVVEDIEHAWFSAIQNSKRAIEACSPLLHEKSVIAISLLKRRSQKNFYFNDTNNSHNVGGGYKLQDPELDSFVKALRSGFGSTEVISLKKQHSLNEENNNNDNNSSSFLSTTTNTAASSSIYEPVVVVCSNESDTSFGVKSPRLNILPNEFSSSTKNIVGGGNSLRLNTFRHDDSRNNNSRKNKTTSYSSWRPKIFISPINSQKRGPKHYTQALVPGSRNPNKFSSQSAPGTSPAFRSKMSEREKMTNQRMEDDEKIGKVVGEGEAVFRDE